jgi:uncharacterized membrane protein
MATVDAGARRKWPRPRVLLALLVVSAALNLFFLAGAAWTRWQPAADETAAVQQHRQIAMELGLDAAQRAALERYVSAMRTRSVAMHQQVSGLISEVWDELAKTNADAGRAGRLLDEAADKRRGSMHEALTQTVEFLAILSPVQRSKFIAAIRDRRPPWQQPQPKSH